MTKTIMILAIVAAFVVGTITTATVVSAQDDTIIACVNNNSQGKDLRIVDSADDCRKNETPLQWNTEGPAGADGAPGANGEDGAPGANGEDGAPGANGADGEDGAPGANGADGEDGAPGANGADGEDGAPGANGADGEDGAPGADGTTDWNKLTNIPNDIADGDQDTLDKLRVVQSYKAKPCSALNNQSWITVDHLMNPEGRVLTQVDFTELPNDFPFLAYASIADPTLAEVQLFAGNFAPEGWKFTRGQLLTISQNGALFSLLGTTYGGNGQTNFALPDLRCLEAREGPRYIIAVVGVFPSAN